MAKLSSFHRALLNGKGLFSEPNIFVSSDKNDWTHFQLVSITQEGSVVGEVELGQVTVLVSAIQSCYVQIIPSVSRSPAGKRRHSRFRSSDADSAVLEDPPLVFVRTVNNERLYFRVTSKAVFGQLMLCLIAWQNLKSRGLAKKWYAENKVHPSTFSDPHELLVCRFKVYGPLPSKAKNVNFVSGAPAPTFGNPGEPKKNLYSTIDNGIQEGWFYAMGALKSNGMLNFITELDGTLLYSIDVKSLFSSEIREVHTSICNSPNILFLGHLNELRLMNLNKTTSAATPESVATESFLVKDCKPMPNNLRIFIEFPLHIDLEDWFVGLNYFCKREYIGMYNKDSIELDTISNRVVGLEGTLPVDSSFDFNRSTNSISRPSLDRNPLRVNEQLPETSELTKFSKDHLRVSKKVRLDIIEANLDGVSLFDGKVYAEIIMWDLPWGRTALVENSANPFWKEEFSTELPILTQMIRIVIKKTHSTVHNPSSDTIIGSVYLTPDILSGQVPRYSTMMMGSRSGEEIKVPGLVPIKDDSNRIAAGLANIIRLSIYESGHIPIGKLLLTVDLKEHHIPPAETFQALETMLIDCPMKELILFCNTTVGATEFQNVSLMLLDIFQSVGVEEKWFKALMEVELTSVDEATRKNYISKSSSAPQSMNVFNTLFRGSSIFTKSLEKYLFRVGQEYLEKVFGDFFDKIVREDKNCELDPRYIKLNFKTNRGDSSGSSDDEDDIASDLDESPDEANRRKKLVEEVVNENYAVLLGYVREIWAKIFTTSNDLPQQIKNQLKNFRTKVDFACDPSDKATALNCLSAFMFLRFFCPAILNPKLFHLTKDHQVGNAQRTLTLVAKILLNLANRQKFTEHKEPHLLRMNDFLDSHEREVLDYFDKLTGRKNDFNEKVLDLSHEMKRFDMGLGGTSSELPTTPYLIDKYLRLTEFVELLRFSSAKNSRASIQSNGGQLKSQVPLPKLGTAMGLSTSYESDQQEEIPLLANGDNLLEKNTSFYQIGTLEFEKSEFLDLAGDNETEGFIKTLCKSNENIFSFIKSAITMNDLQKESTEVANKIASLSQQLVEDETCLNYQHNTKLWQSFVDDVVERGYLDTRDNSLVYQDANFKNGPGLKRLADGGLLALRLRFPAASEDELSDTFSSTSISALLRLGSKNLFKKWLKRE